MPGLAHGWPSVFPERMTTLCGGRALTTKKAFCRAVCVCVYVCTYVPCDLQNRAESVA